MYFYSTYLWTRQQAITYTKLYVLGWDGYGPGMNYTTDHIAIQRCFGVHHKVSCSYYCVTMETLLLTVTSAGILIHV
jgi:hypothetical protein